MLMVEDYYDMIDVKHVHKKFGPTTVVNDVSFSVKQGEVVGFLGPNGAGKTTTVRMIAGVLPPTRGTVEIDGVNLFDEEISHRPHIGYLPENNPIYDDMTVEEFLRMWANLKHIPDAIQQERIDDAVKSAGLDDVFYRPISELSKGYRQRTGLAQAILSQPDILLLDEPTEGLDPNQRNDIHRLIKGLGKKRTVIICSHVLPEITKMCDRVLIINNGQVVADSPTKDLNTLNQGETQYEVVLEGSKVKTTLEGLKSVTKVDRVKEDVGSRYIVSVDSDRDLRLELFDLAKSKKWKLYELMRRQQNLEDIFARLTKGE